MKAIMVMFDSLNRHFLEPYGCEWTKTPNFRRLAEQSITFTNCYVGSMPCMPARRDLQTGRYSFMHRGWGPLEPFDDSWPELMKESGVHTHLVSDHYHYWETGGATYHTKYSTWEFCRGQEGDPWIGEVADPDIPAHVGTFTGSSGKLFRQDWINRKHMATEQMHSQARTFAKGIEFIDANYRENDWFLQIEAFDPHEPFFSPQSYKELYPHRYEGPHFDWVKPGIVQEAPEQVAHLRNEYAALVSMCDAYLGKVLDKMDEYDMWGDTMLIVCTDHGYLLSEHDFWGKNVMPIYNEIANTPLFIWDPRSCRQGVKCDVLTQLIDMGPTLLDYFGIDTPADMLGRSLAPALSGQPLERDAVLFGYHGAHVNCTDGRFVYMRAPIRADNEPLNEYTLMPSRMAAMFTPKELRHVELAAPFSFTKGCKTLKIPTNCDIQSHSLGTLLFDLKQDPEQLHPLQDEAVEKRMLTHMLRLMQECDAPQEQYERLGL